MVLPSHFTKEDITDIKQAVLNAELDTSCEMRVHIENVCPDDNVLDRAAYIFRKLKMHKTELRNGVLFYLAVDSKKFAIIGDVGINAVVDENYWNTLKNIALEYFK